MNIQLKKKIKFIKSVIDNDINLNKNYGFNYAMMDFCRNILLHGTQTKLGAHLDHYYYSKVEHEFFSNERYLKTKNKYKYIDQIEQKGISQNEPVWIFWWQGFEHTPDVVSKCIDSIKHHAIKHPIHFIDKYNYSQYCDIPDIILEKLHKKIITITHFSDILRLALLSQNGGIWMDATIFMSNEFPNELYGSVFFTINHNLFKDSICHGKWTGFFLASTPYNPLICFCRDLIYKYWENENSLICYLLIDVAFSIAYDSFDWAKEMIDSVPINNQNVFWIQEHVNDIYEEKAIKLITRNTCMFKLSYKIEISDARDTVWNVFCRNAGGRNEEI